MSKGKLFTSRPSRDEAKKLKSPAQLGATLLAIFLIAAVFVGFQYQKSRAYGGLDEPISVTDSRFFRNPSGSYPGAEWGWTSYDNHKIEEAKHHNIVVFYQYSSSGYGTYYQTANLGNDWTPYQGIMSSAVVHCPSGATVQGSHNAHLFNSPSLSGMYDGPGHYWCSQNGVGVNPLPGPETGKGMPDISAKASLFKTVVNGQNYYTFTTNNWNTKLQNLSSTNGGYVQCKYSMSGPFASDNHYHCLSADGSREADVDAGSEDILIAGSQPPPTCTLTTDKTSYTTAENVNYTYSCSRSASSITVQVVKPDGTVTTYNTGTNVSYSSMGFSTSNLAPGTHTLRICINDTSCPSSSLVSVAFTLTTASTTTTTGGGITLSGTIYRNGQYVEPDTFVLRNCVSPNGWMKEGTTASGARGFHCMPSYVYASSDSPPSSCTGTLWAGETFSSDYCATTKNTTTTTMPPPPPPPPSNPSTWLSHTWTFRDGSTTSQILNRTDREYLDYVAGIESQCRLVFMTQYGWKPDAGNDAATNWRNFGIPECSGTVTPPPPGPTPPPAPVMTSCASISTGGSYSSICVEPGEYKTKDATKNYWCNGNSTTNPMMFYSSTQVYCGTKTNTSSDMYGMMWTGADIKAKLNSLGNGWGLCGPSGSMSMMGKCYEPGQTTASSMDWCAWWPPNYTGTSMSGSGPRLCPSLDEVSVMPPPGPMPPGPYPPPGNMMRECGPNEFPTGMNTCMMPRYKWNIAEKRFEKCPASETNYISLFNNPAAKYTNCTSFNLEIDMEWRTDRYLVHNPLTDGEEYWPPWDAAAKMWTYDVKRDELVEGCDYKATATAMTASSQTMVIEYVPMCTQIPEKDKGWMLKKFRAEYKMYELMKAQGPVVNSVPVPGEPTPKQVPPVPPHALPVIPEIPVAQCKQYLGGIRQNTASNKTFWKDMRRQLDKVSGYPDGEIVSTRLNEARDIILFVDKVVKVGKCSTETLTDLQEKLNTLNTEIFPDLSSYLPELRDFADYAQCRDNLASHVTRAKGFLKKRSSDATKKQLEAIIGSIEDKLQELADNVGSFDFDAPYECRIFSSEIETDMASLTLESDDEISRIVDELIAAKLAPVLEKLSTQFEERGKKLDTLLVKVAELQRAVEDVSGAASQISDRLAVSLSAMTHIEERFTEQKAQIEAAKDQLIPLVSQVTEMIAQTRCVRGADRETVLSELSSVVAVNWIGDRGESLENRLNAFIASCKAKDISRDDINVLVKSVDEMSTANLIESHEQGLTPFADVPTHEWYYGGMLDAYNNGYMKQGRPGEDALAQDALLMILRTFKVVGVDGNCRLQTSSVRYVSDYAACAVNIAQQKGLSLQANMQSPVQRVEIAEWIAALAPNLPHGAAEFEFSTYRDSNEVNAVQQNAIGYMYVNNVMTGDSDGVNRYFRPYTSLTRAALAVILDNLSRAL